jgi:hypothetical protein
MFIIHRDLNLNLFKETLIGYKIRLITNLVYL